MITKENCFKNLNDARVILNKKTNLQVMYLTDFRANIPVCKDLKINMKKNKNSCYSSHIILQTIQVFWIIYLVPYTTKFSSLCTSVLLSYQRQSPRGAL